MDRKWWTLIAVCVATFMLLLDVTIVNVALPAIQSALKANFSDLQWVVDAYSLLLAALLLTTGSLADLYGRRRVFVIGLIIFTVSSLASGLAQSPLWLNLARAAQGIGGAAMFSTSLALLGSAFQGRERGTAFGIWGAITGLAVAIGPVVGGALTTAISWRWIFLVNVPIGVVAIVLTLMHVEESRQPGHHRIDPIGVITFSASLGALVYALIKANQKGWGSTLIVVLLIGAAVGLILFVIAELTQKNRAMFDLALFGKPTFTGGLIAAFSLSAGFFALFLYLTLYLQDVLGYSALQTGLRFLVLSGGILLTSTLAGRLTAIVPVRFLIAPGLALVGIGLLLMRGVNAGSHWEHLIPGFIVAGAGVGLINPPLASTAIGVVTPDRAGMASGINSTFRQIGIATGIAGLGALFAHTVSTHIQSALRGVPGVSAGAAHAVARTVSQGSGAANGLRSLPAKARPLAAHAVRASFTTGLNDVFLVGALLALASAVLTLVLIRSKDFESGSARTTDHPAPAPTADDHLDPAVTNHLPDPTADDHLEPPVTNDAPEPTTDDVEPPVTNDAPESTADDAPEPATDEALDVPTADDVSEPAGDDAPELPVADGSPEPTADVQPEAPVTSDLLEPAPGAPEPAAYSTLEPTADAPAPVGNQLLRGAQALIAASDEASRDYERQVEVEIGRHRAMELADAEAQSRALLSGAMERNDRYAQSLRLRLSQLSDEREDLVAELRQQTESVARLAEEAAATRGRLYRVIGQLRSFAADHSSLPASDESSNGGQSTGDRFDTLPTSDDRYDTLAPPSLEQAREDTDEAPTSVKPEGDDPGPPPA